MTYDVTLDEPLSREELFAIPGIIPPVKNEGNPNPLSESNYDLWTHEYIYHVHYTMWDRRMDEWVTREKILLPHQYALKAKEEDEILKNETLVGDQEAAHHSEVHNPYVKEIDSIVLGQYEMMAWYFVPFPEEYSTAKTLYFCEFCLSFYMFPAELARHARRCSLKHPPGNEIYRRAEKNGKAVSVFEVDGEKERVYCENLCYIAKMFLDHKLLRWEISPFLFYIVTEMDSEGCHIVGYFSKEKESLTNNLACILTLPCHQKKGYGKFLISVSYELSKIEGKAGGPERPLSDLGQVSYLSYWSDILIEELSCAKMSETTIAALSRKTCILPPDIEETLKTLCILVYYKGRWVLSQTQLAEQLQLYIARKQKLAKKIAAGGSVVTLCQLKYIHWTPHLYMLDKKKKHAPPNP